MEEEQAAYAYAANREVVVCFVVDDPGDAQAIRDRLSSRGWAPRDASDDEAPGKRPGQTHLVAAIPLTAGPIGLDDRAIDELRDTIGRHRGITVLWAAPRTRKPPVSRDRWRVVPRHGPRWWSRLRASITGEVLTLSLVQAPDGHEPHDPFQVRVAGRQLEPLTHWITPMRGWAKVQARSEKASRAALVNYLLSSLLAAIAGAAVYLAGWPWRALWIGVGVVGVVGVGTSLAGAPVRGNRRYWLVGAVLGASVAVGTWFVAASAPAGANIRELLSLLALTGLVGAGLWLVQLVGFRRVTARLRLGVSAVGSVAVALPAIARLHLTTYVEDGFGVPVSLARINDVWPAVLTARVGAILFVPLAALVVLAWLVNHLVYFDRFNRSVAALMLAPVFLSAAANALLSDTSRAQVAFEQAQRAAASGEQPGEYYGIAPRLVCVTPVVERPAVAAGPLPTTHPVLLLDTTDARAWLWDPQRVAASSSPESQTRGRLGALNVPADQLTWTRAVGPRCP